MSWHDDLRRLERPVQRVLRQDFELIELQGREHNLLHPTLRAAQVHVRASTKALLLGNQSFNPANERGVGVPQFINLDLLGAHPLAPSQNQIVILNDRRAECFEHDRLFLLL